MAGPDPRRSSRARTTQSQSQHSSTTSSTSGRAERSTRAFNKTGSPPKSTPTASLSSEPLDESIVTGEDILTRSRRSRAKDEDNDQTSTIADEIEMVNGDELQDEDEAVRCVCGQEDYPGPPSLEDLKHAAKDGFDIDSVFPSEITEDLAGFYVQCDVCKVWQHGACVGLINDETLPEYYYCEECRKDLHKIFTSSNGARFSIYLPLNRASRSGSIAKEEGAGSPKGKDGTNGRASSTNQASKRRSTMNSRDAAYDEEEQLRRAIEASKEDAAPDSADGTARRAKRSRSDSDEKLDSAKRQRTGSRSPSPTVEKQLAGDESDDKVSTRNGALKKSRSAATRGQREKAEREERERQRAEAANKRKGRAERRRADGIQATILVKASEAHVDTDSDPSEEIPLAARALANRPTAAEAPPAPEAPASSQPVPDTPPPADATPTNASKSKGGKPTHKKKGRNQYTKDREARDEASPARSQSRDVQENMGAGSSKTGGADNGKSGSKTKGGLNSKVTMTEMKRRVTAMFDFISKTQVELAGEPAPGPAHESPRSSKENGVPSNLPLITVNGDTTLKKPPDGKAAAENGDQANKDFKEMSCVEMMDFLTRDLVHWQNQFSG